MPPEAVTTPPVETTTQTAPVDTTTQTQTPPVTTTTPPVETQTQTPPVQTQTPPVETQTQTPPVNQWPEQGFPDNWRDRVMIGVEDKDGKIKEMVGKLASPSEFPRALADHVRQIAEMNERTKGMIKIPGEKATDQERADYRKARGVPEKAEDYKPFRPEGMQETPELKALEASFQKVAFETGLTQAEVEGVMKGYYAIEAEASRTSDLRAAARAQETQNALKSEWGADYDANHEITVRALNHYMGPDMKPFLDLELKDGTRVGDHIGTVRGLVRMAKDWSGGTVMIDGMPAEGMDLEGERKKIMGLMHTKPDEYASASVQSRLFKIQEALNRKNGITEMRR
jgi:hypothetical protein